MTSLGRVAILGFLALSTLLVRTSYGLDIQMVYLGGHTLVPGETETFFAPAISWASINNSGQVSSLGAWDSGQQLGHLGMFKWDSGVLSDLMKDTDQTNAPGFGSPVSATQGGYISDTGKVIFDYQVNGVDSVASGPDRQSLLSIVKSNFNIAPGTNTGYTFIGNQAVSSQYVSYYGRAGLNLGIWTGVDNLAPDSLLVLENNTQVPGTGGQLVENITFQESAINNSGLATVNVEYDNGLNHAIVAGNPSNNLPLFTVARTGGGVPGLNGPTFTGSLSRPTLNHTGNIAFTSSVDLGAGNTERGVFRTANNVLATIAVETITEVPGTGGTTVNQIFGRPALAGDDKLYFSANWDNGNSSGLLVHELGQGLSVLHERGDVAPGTGSTFSSFGAFHANANGDYIFIANLLDGREALFASSNGGADLGLLLVEGQILDATGNNEFAELTSIDLPQPSGGEDGRGRWFNDSDQLLVELEFIPSRDLPTATSGLYVITVPEPTSIALLGLAMFGLVWWQRS